MICSLLEQFSIITLPRLEDEKNPNVLYNKSYTIINFETYVNTLICLIFSKDNYVNIVDVNFGLDWFVLLGGLLMALPREQAAAFCKDIEKQEGYQSWIIGIVEKGNRTARIIDKPRVIEVPAKDRDGELW